MTYYKHENGCERPKRQNSEEKANVIVEYVQQDISNRQKNTTERDW